MNRLAILSAALVLAGAATGTVTVKAQTVIDLERGGTVRAKTMDDYEQEQGFKNRMEADSVAYVDHLRRAFNALHRDSLDEAERLFSQALKKRPDAPGNYIVRYNLGRIAMGRNRFREAIDLFSQVLKQRPDQLEARYDRAVCYAEINSLQAAREDCDQLLESVQEHDLKMRGLFLKSAIQMRSHQPDKARETLETILREDPENEGAALLLAGAYEQMGQPQESLSRLNLFVAVHPENTDGLLARAGLEERLQMDDMARADYDAAIRLLPKEAELYVKRARVLLRLGEKGAARKDLDQAGALGYPRSVLNALFQELRK